ncbi:hypothetical protein BDFB_012378 [Asbolus verrucosus]|uniref:Uncharacterized protein n=1 Tax=Asbolus verrucosus TaxID=1661398 RepID=A0A482VX05_ASBVE|nr:hypothetical protein BDFB_012378 [Asbolus verrucosus]
MKFEEEEVTQFIQNDVLETYQKISVTIFHNGILRIILCFIFSALITLELIQTYMFLKKFESIYFIQYGSLYFGVPYILLCAATIPYSLNVVENVFGKVPLWKLDCADDKTEKQIKKEARFLNGFIICFATLGLICLDMCFEMTNEKELFYNEDYQREIEKRLVFCIKHHTEFYK